VRYFVEEFMINKFLLKKSGLCLNHPRSYWSYEHWKFRR